MRRIVVKVGGSLFDLPDLGPRLRHWLAGLGPASFLLVPGGGAVAEVVRDLDQCHHLGEEKSHWLALQAMTLNAHFLQTLLPSSCIVSRPWPDGPGPFLLNAHSFARLDDHLPDRLPHTWQVTSDSVAARAAIVGAAHELVLLKSASLPKGATWDEVARAGLVDAFFPELVRKMDGVRVWSVNLRQWQS
jgi:aspartokinase-like uncharacterized kinase